MKKKNLSLILMLLILVFTLFGCEDAAKETETEDAVLQLQEKVASLETSLNESAVELAAIVTQLEESKQEVEALNTEIESLQSSSTSLLSAATNVVTALSTQDMATLSTYVHPTSGVRFSPYSYVDTAVHLNFNATAISTLLSDTTLYTWGTFDGSGDPIIFKFSDYFDAFVYDEDYLNPHMIGMNNFIGSGNSLNNVSTVYPGSSFVEFHFTGFDPQYQGIDWSSLILVFENVSGNWKLVGIIHSQWTI